MDFWIKGMDLSSLLEVEECGGIFYDQGKPGDAMEILQGYGMNLIRLRLWNDPYTSDRQPYGAGTCDLPRVMTLARRAQRLGISWMLDFHYSDFWADPGKQILPKAWEKMNCEELEAAVYQYTAATMVTLKEAHLLPAIASVGNELSNGLLWPYGKYPNFNNIARFINAAIHAIQKIAPETAVMIHLDNGAKNELYKDWFRRYFAAGGEDFQYIGLSYYPFWHGKIEGLRQNMNDIALRYHKDLIIAEASFGFTLEDYQQQEQLPADQRKGMASTPELAEKTAYPMTPEGQCTYIQELADAIRQVPEGRGKGFIYWEAAWIPVPGSQWANEAALGYIKESGPGGNEWANQALFNYEGHALPALSLIRDL